MVTAIMKSSSGNVPRRWSLLTNHGHALACIAANPDGRLRDIAESIGVTERTAAQIVSELEQEGYLTRIRVGRRNRYEIDGKRKVRTPGLPTMTVAELLSLLQQALEQPFA
jgi:DNA-binding Lrp family transcriptional regulator